MELGIVGLGRMGANMARRLMKDGHTIVAYDVSPDAVKALEGEGATGASSLEDLASKLDRAALGLGDGPRREDHRGDRAGPGRRALLRRRDHRRRQLLLPRRHAPRQTRRRERDRLRRLRDQRRRLRPRARLLPDDRRPRRGGRAARPDLRTSLAPGVGAAERTPGLTGDPTPAEEGYLHCGPNGAGHFVKMVHNGIEYGIMAAYAEGLNVLDNADAGKTKRLDDAETAPLDQPEYYEFDLDIPAITEVWRRGSVVGSWLLDLTAAALRRKPRARPSSPAASPTPARGAGPRSPRSRRGCRPRSSPPPCTSASSRATSATSATKSSRRCAMQFGGHHEQQDT